MVKINFESIKYKKIKVLFVLEIGALLYQNKLQCLQVRLWDRYQISYDDTAEKYNLLEIKVLQGTQMIERELQLKPV